MKIVERYTAELQAALDRVCEFAEANVKQAGTGNFLITSAGGEDCRLLISDFRLELDSEVRSRQTVTLIDLQSEICNLILILTCYSRVEPSSWYLYFLPSQKTTEEVFSPSPVSSM